MGRPKLYPHQLPNVLVDERTRRAIEAELGRRRAYDQRTPQSDVVRDFLAAGAALADHQAAGRRVRVLVDDNTLTDTAGKDATAMDYATPERGRTDWAGANPSLGVDPFADDPIEPGGMFGDGMK